MKRLFFYIVFSITSCYIGYSQNQDKQSYINEIKYLLDQKNEINSRINTILREYPDLKLLFTPTNKNNSNVLETYINSEIELVSNIVNENSLKSLHIFIKNFIDSNPIKDNSSFITDFLVSFKNDLEFKVKAIKNEE